jgi:hypothetical protein
LWEAFLLQMNDFDRLLELKLRQMLDPVVAGRPPSRRGRLSRPQKPILAVVKAAVELPGEVNPTLEPAVVTVPVASASLV